MALIGKKKLPMKYRKERLKTDKRVNE